MSTRKLVDPELLHLIDGTPPAEWSLENLRVMRAAMAGLRGSESDEQILVEEIYIPAENPAPDIRLLVYRPRNIGGTLPAVLGIHGGGFVLGSPEMQDADYRRLMTELPCVIVSVDYRLAPETGFPGPVEDCYAALRWIHKNAKNLRIDPLRVAISGISAGGGLAASTSILARDRGEFPVAFQHLLRPMLDDRTGTSRRVSPLIGEFIWTKQANAFGWRAMLGEQAGGEGVSPYAAPSRLEDFSGLPPTFLSVGALDLFVEENMAFAQQLIFGGVPTELHVHPGLIHGSSAAPGAQINIEIERASHAAFRKALAKKGE